MSAFAGTPPGAARSHGPAHTAMTTRETTTDDGTAWTLAEAAAHDGPDGTTTVVATPSGGEQTVRLTLDAGWLDAPDDDLAGAIDAARAGRPGGGG